MAIGMFVVPMLNYQEALNAGMKFPNATPTIMARKIHTVRYLSKKLSYFFHFK